jgi:DNA-binding transcriptional LysR family regulator
MTAALKDLEGRLGVRLFDRLQASGVSCAISLIEM